MGVLKELGLNPSGLTLSQLAKRIDVPKTSLLSLIKALEEADYIRNIGQLYMPGPNAISLGNILADRDPYSMQWILEELVASTHETALIAKLSPSRRTVVYTAVKDAMTNGVRFSIPVGTENELYMTAPGKVFLAFFEKEELRSYLSKAQLLRKTGKTITNKEVLAAQLTEIRKSGFATVKEEPFEGVYGAAAPVFDRDGCVTMAVVTAAPHDRGVRKQDNIRTAIFNAARAASVVLGYAKNYPFSP